MGIPRLTSTLQPYAVDDILRDRDVVIDGPAFAHHILNKCWASGIGHPSYGLLGRSAIAWLDELGRYLVRVNAIYFDGGLPTEKRPVRMERLARSTAQLSQLFSANPQACPRSHLYPGTHAVPDLFSLSPAPNASRLCPSFLVPAVIDALRLEPRYRALVHIVPGEADDFCARQASLNGACVLTSDSDLLAHDLGNGCVMFFRDLYMNADSELTCATLDPASICHKLGLPPSGGLRRFAYERRLSVHARTPELIRRCSSPPSDETDYRDFCDQYLNLGTDPIPHISNGNVIPLEGLDPRMSELIVQLGVEARKDSTAEDTAIKVYLPTLVDDPSRGSAWEQSAPIRQLAYSVAAWATNNSAPSLQEYRRVQEKDHKGRQVDLWTAASAEQPVGDLVRFVAQVRTAATGDVGLYWPLVCLALDIRECQELGKSSHALIMLQQSDRAPLSSSLAGVPWGLVHLVALLQASHYSLRMLKQALSILPEGSCGSSLPPDLSRLRDLLSDFPPLLKFPDVNGTLSWLGTADNRRLLEMLREFVDVPPTQPAASNKSPTDLEKKKKKKKEKKKKATGKSQRGDRGRAAGDSRGNLASATKNIFGLLSIE